MTGNIFILPWISLGDDRARTAACSLRTVTDRFKDNYNIDVTSALLGHLLVIVSSHPCDILLSEFAGDRVALTVT